MDAGPTDSDGQTEARVHWRETTGSHADCHGDCGRSRVVGHLGHLGLCRDLGHDPPAISTMTLADGPQKTLDHLLGTGSRSVQRSAFGAHAQRAWLRSRTPSWPLKGFGWESATSSSSNHRPPSAR